MITRWDKWFSDDNLAQDPRILAAPPSRSAENAAEAFITGEKRVILDLACGIGRDTFYLESRGLDVSGVDASLNGLRVAQRVKKEQGMASGLIMADARCLPFADGSFDGVFCFGLLHEFTAENREEDVESVMAEIKRLLCDAGILVITVLSGERQAGLPAVQLYSRGMFEEATKGWQALEIRTCEDVGCTGRPDYRVWYGMFAK